MITNTTADTVLLLGLHSTMAEPNSPQLAGSPNAAAPDSQQPQETLAAQTTTSPSRKDSKGTNHKKDRKPPDFNPRWKGYVYIGFTSLVNFASIAGVPRGDRRSYWAATLAFGIFTFALSVLVLIQDRSQSCLETFHYTKAREGYFEGYTLLFSSVLWTVGVAYQTTADGIAYVANNIYFSAWLSLFSTVYTLNEWSASKDILSIAELTGLSATLKSWYVLFLSSLVVMGTCIDLHVRIPDNQRDRDDTSFGIALGVVSTVMSLFWIFTHYEFIPNVKEGGWLELSSSFFLIGIYVVGLAILTQDQGIAATTSGTQCARNLDELDDALLAINCTINYWAMDVDGNPVLKVTPCTDLPRQVPGSNLYFAVWACFAASFNITLRWKAAQALNLAQAQEEKERRRLEGGGNENGDFSEGSDDDF